MKKELKKHIESLQERRKKRAAVVLTELLSSFESDLTTYKTFQNKTTSNMKLLLLYTRLIGKEAKSIIEANRFLKKSKKKGEKDAADERNVKN